MRIRYFNRDRGEIELERVYQGFIVNWLYNSFLGSLLCSIVSRMRWISAFYGAWQNFSLSRYKIDPFVKKFDVDMREFMPAEGDSYPNFNSFFIRKFRPNGRSFDSTPEKMPAFCEGRYFGHSELTEDKVFPVKGRFLRAGDLLGSSRWASTFEGGPILLARLCPSDYHRFHFPDDGKIIDSYPVEGVLHSVNPVALKRIPGVFFSNKRVVSILDTKNFGTLAYIEVGAICVGSIVSTTSDKNFTRGQEKGFFRFGGSSILLMGTVGSWTPWEDILEHTAEGIETYIKLGSPVGRSELGPN